MQRNSVSTYTKLFQWMILISGHIFFSFILQYYSFINTFNKNTNPGIPQSYVKSIHLNRNKKASKHYIINVSLVVALRCEEECRPRSRHLAASPRSSEEETNGASGAQHPEIEPQPVRSDSNAIIIKFGVAVFDVATKKIYLRKHVYGAKLISQQSQLICLYRECHTFMAHYVHRNFLCRIQTQARFNTFLGFLSVRIYLIHRKYIPRNRTGINIMNSCVYTIMFSVCRYFLIQTFYLPAVIGNTFYDGSRKM